MKALQAFCCLNTLLALISPAASLHLSHNRETRLGALLEEKIPIDIAKKYYLGWTVDTDKEEITYEAVVETKGYIGFGLSPNGAMTGADLFIAGVNDDGSKYSGDYHGTSNGMPTLDKQQDWKLLEATENETHTSIKFSRILDTCDEEDIPIKGETNRVIWSYGHTDKLEHHAERDTLSANFLIPDQPFDTSKYNNFTIMLDREMPSQDTTYWCTLHKGPDFEKKQHIVGFEPNLPSLDAEKYSHHVSIYRCEAPEGQDPDDYFGQWKDYQGGHCYSGQVPFFTSCVEFVFVWAKGGKRMVMPENVGYPVGEVRGRSQYYMLEVHYDNPKQEAGKKFTTGLRVFHTDQLRETEAAIMIVGADVNPSLVVPTQKTDYVVARHCSPDCTKRRFPEEGITIFNSLLHAHLSGRKLKARHFRDGQELPWIDSDSYYYFNFQQNKPLKKFVKVMPGDQITYECTYDSTWHENKSAITGGFSSSYKFFINFTHIDEMCEVFIWYYPKTDMIRCRSTYPLDKGVKEFGVTKYHEELVDGFFQIFVDEPENMKGPFKDAISYNFTWTNEFLKEFQEKRRFGVQESSCTGDEPTPVKYMEVAEEYVPQGKCDGSGSGTEKLVFSTTLLTSVLFSLKLF